MSAKQLSWLHVGFPTSTVSVIHSKYDAGELKSGIQKYIRRAEVEKAVRVADEMLRTCPGSLFRRLPSIIAEDCGWRKIWIVNLCRNLRWGEAPLEAASRLNFLMAVAKAASDAKDKDGPGLYFLVSRKYGYSAEEVRKLRLGTDMPTEEAKKRLEDAFIKRDELEIARLIFPRFSVDKPQNAWFWSYIANAGIHRELDEWDGVVGAVKRRIGMLGFRWAEDIGSLVFSLVQAVCRDGTWDDEISDDLLEDVRKWGDDFRPSTLDWYCLDMHTIIGKIASGHLCKKHGFDKKRFEDIWFCFGSAQVNSLLEQRWFDNWAGYLELSYGISVDDGYAEYLRYEEDIRGLIPWLMDKRGKL